eukprot:5646819-Prymnesium_polylepis.1
MEYLGRINLTIAEHTGETVTVDHWANWCARLRPPPSKPVGASYTADAPILFAAHRKPYTHRSPVAHAGSSTCSWTSTRRCRGMARRRAASRP